MAGTGGRVVGGAGGIVVIGGRGSTDLFQRAVRCILRLYSPGFRRLFGEDLTATLVRERRNRERGGWWKAAIWSWAVLVGLSWQGMMEAVQSRSRGLRPARRDSMRPRQVGEATVQIAKDAVRRITRAPVLALGMVAAFAIGIGANAALYRMADRLLLSPPPHLHQPEKLRLLAVARYSGYLGKRLASPLRSYPELQDWKAAGSLAGVAGYDFAIREQTVGHGDDAWRLRTQAVTGGYFPLLGTAPRLGRLLGPSDDRLGAEPVVVISEQVWSRDFGGLPSVLGRTLDFGRGPHVIVGVAPRGFTGVDLSPVDAWIPVTPYRQAVQGEGWDAQRQSYWLRVVARLRPGVTDRAAAAELTALHRAGWAREIEAGRYGGAPAEADPGPVVVPASIVPGQSVLQPAEARVARWLLGVSLALLLLAAVNVANLLLARQIRTQRETAMRKALGASGWRLAAQEGMETLLVAGAGAAAALGITALIGQGLRELLLPDALWDEPLVPMSLVAATLLLALVAAGMATVLPAIRALRADPGAMLRTNRSGHRAGRIRAGLLVVQVALSMLLLVGASLFVQSFATAVARDPGIDAEHAYLLDLSGDVPQEQMPLLLERAVQRLTDLPGVEAAAASSTLPFYHLNASRPRVRGGDTLPEPMTVHAVSGDYFPTMGLSALQGRALEPADRAGAPWVAAVNQTAAERFWPDGALGECLYIGESGAPCTQIVGVVENARIRGVTADAPPQYYVPAAQQTPAGPLYALMLRVRTGSSAATLAQVRHDLHQLDPRVRYVDAQPVAAPLEHELRPWRIGATLFVALGSLALVLAVIGLHALLAFDITQRVRELGIRAALGATRSRLLGGTMRRGIGLTLGGAVAGAVVAYAVAPGIEELLFETTARDPTHFLAAATGLGSAALLVSLLAGRRAARVKPMEALRADQ